MTAAELKTANAAAFAEFEAQCNNMSVALGKEKRDIIYEFGKHFVRAGLSYTPPNYIKRGGRSAGILNKNSEGIQRLKARITEDLGGSTQRNSVTGAAEANVTLTKALPFLRKNKWAAKPEGRKWNALKVFEPLYNGKLDKQPHVIKSGARYLEEVRKRTKARKTKGAIRLVVIKGKKYVPIWASEKAVASAIRAQHRRVGRMLSGWRKAAAVFFKGRPPAGVHASMDGKGSARLVFSNFSQVSAVISNNEDFKHVKLPWGAQIEQQAEWQAYRNFNKDMQKRREHIEAKLQRAAK